MRSIEPDKINQRIILLASQDTQGLRYYNLRLSLSIKPDILSHRLKRMLKAGLIQKTGSGRDATYYATQKGLEFLKESEKPKRQYVNGRVSEIPNIKIIWLWATPESYKEDLREIAEVVR